MTTRRYIDTWDAAAWARWRANADWLDEYHRKRRAEAEAKAERERKVEKQK